MARSVFDMTFSQVYGALVAKAKRKGRTKEEVHQAASWLTGYTKEEIEAFSREDLTYGEFLQRSPQWNPERENIKGTICGIKIEEIQDPLTKEMRRLDKLVDDLAKGKDWDKIIKKK